MLDYDAEAERYDRTRGGVPRAEAAARAVLGLVPAQASVLLDVACGTGLVTARLARPGLRVLGADTAFGMARLAAERNGGGVVRADGRRLPVADGAVDAVTAIWLLHLLQDRGAVEAVVAEAARVLTPGGVFVTTVDKTAGHHVGSDIDALLAPHRSGVLAPDAATAVEGYGARHGLRAVGEARFTGHGQGRSPLRLAAELRQGGFGPWGMSPETTERLAAAVESLPEPGRPRADPEFRVIALGRAR